METIIIWVVVMALVITSVSVYAARFRRQRALDSQRLHQTRELGMDKAAGQYPLVDAGACIGCGTCVAACPEGDVLGVVMGKAVVINGARCIGHGKCAEACPVGAIKVGLGDITKRDDIPLLDEHNQTNVPGIWIAGELSGFALINNAVEQGRRVMERIAATGGPKSAASGGNSGGGDSSGGDSNGGVLNGGVLNGGDPSGGDSNGGDSNGGDSNGGDSSGGVLLDALVVGAGPAGMSAGLVASEHGLSCLILDQQGAGGTILQYPRRKLVMVQPVEIPRLGRLPRHEYSKEELLEIWEKLHSDFDLDIRTGVRVTGVVDGTGNFLVQTSAGEFRCRNIILALGRRGTPRRLNVPGEDLAKVAYKLIDAEAYQGRRVLVVGGGDSAVEAAMGLAHQEGCQVTMSYRKAELMRIKQRNADRIAPLIADGTLKFLGATTVTSIHEDMVTLEGPDGPIIVPNDDVFILAGGIPPFGFLRELGVKFGGDQQDITAAVV